MPYKLWAIPRAHLNYQQKHLLSLIWWCAPKGCHCWNNRLAKKFGVCPRTIRRWLAQLKKLELIAIGYPDGRGRTIWPRYNHPPAIPPAKKPISQPVSSAPVFSPKADTNVHPR